MLLKIRTITAIAVLGLVLISTPQVAGAEPLQLFVSILPQKYMVQQIGKQWVDVKVMVPPGAGPATYEPKPSQMATLMRCKIYFSVGVPFEKAWLPKISATNPNMKLVATDQGIDKRPMVGHYHHEEQQHHNQAGDHDQLRDPHIWLSPPLIRKMAYTIYQALAQAMPEHSIELKQNLDLFEQSLDRIDQQILQLLSAVQGKHFLVFHPSWGYFADHYGLVQIPIEIQGKTPKPAELKQLIDQAKALQAKAIFVQPQFSKRSAQIIANAIGAQVIPADPLAEDLLDNLLQQAERFQKAVW